MPTQSLSRAALWMAGWLTAMLAMTITGRELTQELPVFVVMLWRSVLAILIISPIIVWGGGRALRTDRLGWHAARNAAHYSAQFCWFLAISLIPLAQVVAIEFTMPLWVAILATLFLGERLTLPRIAALALGFAGILIIIRPGVSAIGLGQAVALYAAVVFAASTVMTKTLTRTESALTIIFYMFLLQGLVGLVPAIYVWTWPSPDKWPWLVVLGLAGTASHFCLSKAVAAADATVVVPMDFMRVPLTAFAGWLLYAEGIDAFLVVGAVLILSGNLLNLRGLAAPPSRAIATRGAPVEYPRREHDDRGAPP